jgi:HSP20 family protein
LKQGGGRSWSPPVDVYRSPRGWVVKFELAGVSPEDVEVEASGSMIRVRGVRRDWLVQQGCCPQSLEIPYSRFDRSISLPCSTEGRPISHEYVQGLLIVHVDTEEPSA